MATENDCVHVQLYRDSKDRYNNGQTKASLSLQHFLAVQSGFTLDKESNTIAILCEDVTVIFAFDTREQLIQWQAKIAINLGEDEQFLVQISSAPPRSKLASGPARLHVLERRFCLTAGVPPRLLGHWRIAQLRKYGVVNGRFCFEGGSQCGRGEGLHVLLTDRGDDVCRAFRSAARGDTPLARRAYLHVRERSISSSRTEANLCEQLADCRSRSQENICWSSPGDWGEVEPTALCHRDAVDPVSRPRCRSCHVRLARSSTVTGFTWTMEHCGLGQTLSKSPSCVESRQTNPSVSIWDPASPGRPPPRPPKTKSSAHPAEEVLKRPRPSPSMPALRPTPSQGRCGCDAAANMVEDYYDTPRSFKNSILEETERSEMSGQSVDQSCHCHMNTGMSQSFSVNQTLFGYTANGYKSNYCQGQNERLDYFSNLGHIYQNEEEPTSLSSDPGWRPETCSKQEHSSCCCYMNVKANTLCQAKRCAKSVTFSGLPKNPLSEKPNYENFDFAESLKYYENCKDCYNKLVREFESDREFSFNLDNNDFCRGCSILRQRNLNPLLSNHKNTPDDTQGYIKMSSLANITDNSDDIKVINRNNCTPTRSFSRLRSKSSLCLHSACRHSKDYKIQAISDPEIHLIPLSQKRPKISLSKLIDFIRNLRPVTAQEIQRHARKVSTQSFRSRLEESQYHSDDTISSDTMVNTANDMSVKGSLNSLCSDNTRFLGANRFLPASEINLSLSSVPDRIDGQERDIEKYKEHLRSLQLPRLPTEFECSTHDSFSVVRRSCTVNFKPGHNRDSSSSNDSGVSTASLRLRRTDFTEFEMPITTSLSAKLLREYALRQMKKSSSDLSLPRRSKSIDPLGELVFQFQDSSNAAKSTSALLTVVDGREGKILRFIDAPSTSSGTSDLSDYMDNLSISSYSSNEHPRVSRCPAPTLKPRSGKEYHKIGHLSLQPTKEGPGGPEDQSSV